MMKVVIEHLEPEVYEWCEIEYERISKLIGNDNLTFTNVSDEKLKPIGKAEPKSVKELKFEKACVLDPEATETLTPEKAKEFDVFIFGGILGDNPPKDRTKTELTKFLPYPAFNLGKEQMSTDTAVQVTKLIHDGTPLEEMEFVNGLEIVVADGLTVTLPYKYLILEEEIQIDPRIIENLRKQEGI